MVDKKLKKMIIPMIIIVVTSLVFCACSKKDEEVPEITTDTVNVEITMEDGGVIELELDNAVAPITVQNFVGLAEQGFYDGLTFHRIIPGFMIQGGDPEGTGEGGSGKTIKGEFELNGVENSISHTEGIISMARKPNDMDSASSQFFITNEISTFLDGEYAAFGRVVAGMNVVQDISSVETDGNDKPLKDVVIESIKVIR